MRTIVNRHYLRVAPDCTHPDALRTDAQPPQENSTEKELYYCPTCDANLTGTEYHHDQTGHIDSPERTPAL